MTAIKPKNIFVPVSVKEDNPGEDTYPFVITDGYGCNIVAHYINIEYQDDNLPEGEGSNRPVDMTEFVTHFLKEQQGYVFTKDELIVLLTDARKEMADNLLKQISSAFGDPDNQNKADRQSDKDVFQAVSDTILNFPVLDSNYVKELLP